MSFLEHRHPKWEENHEKWQFAWENYTGDYAAHNRIDLFRIGSEKRLRSDKYLHRKVQAETREAYMERIMTSDPVLLFPTSVDSLNGIMLSKDDKTSREWGDLGDPEEEGTTAFKLYHNADGEGTNWNPLMKQAAIRQSVNHWMWALVDGVDESGEAKIKLIDPVSVVNWYPSTGMPNEVLVKESRDFRGSMEDKTEFKDTYVHYTDEGWIRYVKTDKGEQVVDSGEYTFYADKNQSEKILPIFPVKIPMPRNVGYLLALKQNHFFNAKSIRDFSVRNMAFAKLVISADSNQFDDIMEKAKKGYNLIREDQDANGHRYISPPSDYLTEAGEILERNKKEFMENAFRHYGDAARQSTATEIRQESRSGVEAFLSLLVTSLDEFENKCFWLLEQIYFPEEPSRWGQANVQRSQNFQPEDVNEALQKRSETVRNASTSNAMSIETRVRTLHPDWSDEEVDEEVSKINQENGAIPDPMVGG